MMQLEASIGIKTVWSKSKYAASQNKEAHTVHLIDGNLLNVNFVLLSVNADDLSFSSLLFTTDDQNLIVFVDWNGTNLMV